MTNEERGKERDGVGRRKRRNVILAGEERKSVREREREKER